LAPSRTWSAASQPGSLAPAPIAKRCVGQDWWLRRWASFLAAGNPPSASDLAALPLNKSRARSWKTLAAWMKSSAAANPVSIHGRQSPTIHFSGHWRRLNGGAFMRRTESTMPGRFWGSGREN